MSFPIVPGPFSFLQGAHEAGLDAYYRAQARNDMLAQLKRQQDMQNVGLYTNLVQLGLIQPTQGQSTNLPAIPTPMGLTPPVTVPGQVGYELPGGVAESFGRLGLGRPKLGRSPKMRQEAVAADVAEQTADLSVRGAKAETSLLESKAELTDAEVEGLVNELRNMTPEQIRARGNIPGAAVAKLRETLDFEKAQTELLGQPTARKNFEVESMIQDAILKDMPKDENFRRVAKYAAVGGIGWLIAGLQNRDDITRMRLAQNREQLQMFTSLETTARQQWIRSVDDYQTQLNRAISQAVGIMPEGSEKQKKKKAEAMANAIAAFKSVNPEPTYENILDAVLNTHNITRDAYNEAFKTLVQIESGSKESSVISGSSSRAAQPTDAPKTAGGKTEEQLFREAFATAKDDAARQRMRALYKQRTGKEPPL